MWHESSTLTVGYVLRMTTKNIKNYWECCQESSDMYRELLRMLPREQWCVQRITENVAKRAVICTENYWECCQESSDVYRELLKMLPREQWCVQRITGNVTKICRICTENNYWMSSRDAEFVQKITECHQEMQNIYRDLLRMKPRDVEYVQRITELLKMKSRDNNVYTENYWVCYQEIHNNVTTNISHWKHTGTKDVQSHYITITKLWT